MGEINEEKTVEILVGYDGYYNFGINGENRLSTNNWDRNSFYKAGSMAAVSLERLGTSRYAIVNGQRYEIVYEIPEDKAKAMIRMRSDDAFCSIKDPPYHIVKTGCRPLLPEQIAAFKNGLEHRLQILQGKIIEEKPQEADEPRDSLSLYLSTASISRNLQQMELRDHIKRHGGFNDETIEKYLRPGFKKLFEATICGKVKEDEP